MYGLLAEELQEGFGAVQSEFRDYRGEFRSFAGELRDYRQEFRDYRQEFRGFSERTDLNVKVLDGKYGEISAKLGQLLEAYQRDSLETRRELTKAVDRLAVLVAEFIESRRVKVKPLEETA